MSLRPALLAALALVGPLALAPPAEGRAQAGEAREPAPFAWGPRADDLAALAPPTPGSDGWRREGPRAFVRDVPSFTGDPTLELVVATRDERGRDVWSRLVLQVPADFDERPMDGRDALLVLHASGESERAPFVATELPFLASRSGRMVIAPFRRGPLLTSAPSASLEAVLERVYELRPFDFDGLHVLALGEGVLEALELAQGTHGGLRVASLVCDPALLNEERADPFATLLGLRPPGRGDGAEPAPAPEPIETRPGLPVFLHANLAEPTPRPAERAFALERALRAGGALVIADYGVTPALDGPWADLPLERAFEAIAERSAPPPSPTPIAVLAQPFGKPAHHRLELAPARLGTPNAASLEVRDVGALVLDLPTAGLDPGQTLTVSVESLDGVPLELSLRGYAAPPRDVELDGRRLRGWRHDLEGGVLWLETPARRGASIVIVRP